jgi:hypothetical protein
VDTHLGAIRRKLGVHSRAAFTRRLYDDVARDADGKTTQFTRLLRGRPASQADRVQHEPADRSDPGPAASNLATDPVDEPDAAPSANPVSEQPPAAEEATPSGEDPEGWVPA